MPSPHRRIGLIVDEPVRSALGLFRDSNEAIPEARIARWAVLEGALVEAMVKTAVGNGAQSERAAEIVLSARDLLPALPLSDQLKEVLLVYLGRVQERPSRAERRRRQFALLGKEPRPTDRQTAQALADAFDAFERLPAG